jgi:para-aminobenzoate synthetase component 1
MKNQTLPNRYSQGAKMPLYSAFLGGWVQPADVFAQFYANEPNAFWLDGEFAPQERFSILGAGVVAASNTLIERPSERFENVDESEIPFKWRPGLVGWVTYEIEPTFIDANRAIIFDHEQQGLYFVGSFDNKTAFDFWHHAALLRLGLSGGQIATLLHRRESIGSPSKSTLRHDSSSYISMIESAQRHIRAGDVYQICLTNQIEVITDADPLEVFMRLRASNPAPYSAFIRIGSTTLVSSSPEQFLQISAEGQISTKPIKGTRPRGADEQKDKAIAESLRTDLKERAENLMIVDLMRNDIGKVSRVGTVAVPKLFDVETYATVHQLVSTVTGELAEAESAWTAISAAFPGGSMTGAPKIRAMELIREFENGPRGIYSGCVGYLASNGSAELAMVIRSITFTDGRASIGVGGGITIDSDPAAELEETKLKAKVLLAALNAADPWA